MEKKRKESGSEKEQKKERRMEKEGKEEERKDEEGKEKEEGEEWKKTEDREKEKERLKELEEREEKVRRRIREEERKLEKQRREMRRGNVIWRGVEGEDGAERREMIRIYTEKVLGRETGMRVIAEMRGEDGGAVIMVRMDSERDKNELIEKKHMVWKTWRVGIDEDLTMEERRIRWVMIGRCNRERAKGRKAVVRGRRLWIDGKEWVWDEEKESLEEKEEGNGKEEN